MLVLAIELAVVLGLTLLNGVFSGAEIALLSVRKTRLAELADGGSGGARAALALRRDPERLLATIQVAITVIGATTAVFGGSRLARPITTLLSWIGLGRYAESVALVLVVVLVSYLSLVLGELVPKSLALLHAERFSLRMAPLLYGLARVAHPAVWLLTASSNLILRPLKDRTTFTESRLSPDELQQLVEEAAATGSLPAASGEIASRAIDLGRLRASAVMVPRQRIVSLPVDASEAELRARLHEHPHARYPVHEERDPERVIGYVVGREVFARVMAGKHSSLHALLRPVTFAPVTTPVVDLLRDLQASRQQLALVVDEVGGIAGLLTIEDIAEELLGEILEEHEHHEPYLLETPDGAVMVRGDAPIHEVERELDIDLDAPPSSTTMAGLTVSRLGRIPAKGDRVALGPETTGEVVEATDRAVTVLRIERTRPGSGDDPAP